MKKGIVAGMSLLIGGTIGAGIVGALNGNIIDKKEGKIDKFKSYYNMLNQWLILKQEGKTLEDYFVNHNIYSIAIYGMGEMGNRLYDELKNSEKVKVKYAIDKEAGSTYAEIDVKELEDDLEKVDAIVVTAIFAFGDISEEVNEVVDYPIISLEDIVFEV